MTVNIGSVETFKNLEQSKEQALKPLEEAAEVFGAWQNLEFAFTEYDVNDSRFYFIEHNFVDECCDLIQATCNLLFAYGVDDIEHAMKQCKVRNESRGRKYE